MALFNYAGRELTLKVVYYGPGLSGKTTNLAHIHSTMPQKNASKMLSLSTETDRTLFFDFLPVAFKKSKDFTVRFQLYTVPGQVRYNATRKLVLKGADAIIFVADSQKEMREYNIESLQNMKENMKANNLNLKDVPIVLQYNKRDLSNLLSTEELDADLNAQRWPAVSASAINGAGVKETFQTVARLLMAGIRQKHGLDIALDFETGAEKPPTPEIKAQPGSAHPPKAAHMPAQAMPVDSISKEIFYGQPEEALDSTGHVERQVAAAEPDRQPEPPAAESSVEKQAPAITADAAGRPASPASPSQESRPAQAAPEESPGHLDKTTQALSFAVFDASVHMKNSSDAILRSLAMLSDSLKMLAGELREIKENQKEIEKTLRKNPTL